jgi:tripartite-type tricarboxylate transporter receptor subunit TctC
MNVVGKALVAVAILAAASHTAAQTSSYPNRPVRLIVPVAPGGGTDIIARSLAQKLADAWGQTVVVDNRAGAGSTVGTALAVKAAPDGYTLVLVSIGLAFNESLYAKLPYDTLRDLAPITLVATQPNLLVINPAVPARTVAELVQLAKTKPGSLAYASGGAGSASHLSGELFRSMAGIAIVHVPYKGTAPALTDLVAGQVQLLITPMVQALPLVTGGRVRALAVTSVRRSNLMPNVPTLAEAGVPGYEFNTWYGILAPAGTPKPVVDRLQRDSVTALGAADLRERFSAGGLEPLTSTPEEFAAYLRAEIAKWGRIIRDNNLRAD